MTAQTAETLALCYSAVATTAMLILIGQLVLEIWRLRK